MRDKSNIQSWLLLICLTLIWGSSYILMKKALIVFTPIQMAALRISIAGLACMPFLPRAIGYIPGRLFPKAVFVALIGSGIPAFLFAFAMTRISSSVNGIINSLSPLFTVLTGLLFWGIVAPRAKVAGVFVGFIGAVILVFGEHGLVLDGRVGYAVLPVIATFCYGTNSNYVRQNFPHTNPILLTALGMAIIGIPALGILLCTGFVRAMHQPGAWTALACVAILGAFGTVVANMLFYRLIQRSGPLFAASVTYLMPIVAIGWGLTDGEILAPYHLTGLALILTGVYFVSRPAAIKAAD